MLVTNKVKNSNEAYKVGFVFNPLLQKYSFSGINNKQLFKTLWEKKKLLVTSNFSFSHNVFYSIR